MSDTVPTSASPAGQQRENLWVNLACNALIPGLILNHLSKPGRLGPLYALLVAIAFPLGYGIWDLVTRRKWNVLSVIGLVGTLATGGLGVGTHFGWWRATGLWYAVKEAVIPLLLGAAIPISMGTRQPLVKTMLYNDQVLDTQRIAGELKARGNETAFENLLRGSSWLLTLSFLISATLNFGLAIWLLKAEPGTEQFNAQLGRMNWLSWPVIVIPSMIIMMWALFRLMNGVERLTGLKVDQILHQPPAKPAAN
jgi:hypothetical protein